MWLKNIRTIIWATSCCCYAVLGLRLMQNHKFMFHLITYESLVWQSTWTYHVVVQRLEKKIFNYHFTITVCERQKRFAILVSNFKATGVTNFFEAKNSCTIQIQRNSKSRSLDSYGNPHEALGIPIGEHILATCYVGEFIVTFKNVILWMRRWFQLQRLWWWQTRAFHPNFHGIISTWNLGPMSEENVKLGQAFFKFLLPSSIFVLSSKAIHCCKFCGRGWE